MGAYKLLNSICECMCERLNVCTCKNMCVCASENVCVCVCVCVCTCACMYVHMCVVCVCACVRACVRVCVHLHAFPLFSDSSDHGRRMACKPWWLSGQDAGMKDRRAQSLLWSVHDRVFDKKTQHLMCNRQVTPQPRKVIGSAGQEGQLLREK